MNEEITISPINPTTFEIQNYNISDTELIAKSELDTVFSSSTDYIEYYIYDENQILLYPQDITIPLTSFNIRQGDVLLDPQSDLENLGFDIGKYSILYNFYRRRLGSNITENYYIKEISSDRTEIRLDSNVINNQLIISSSTEFIQYRENQPYFVDFYLNFGGNKLIIANNLSLDIQNNEDPTLLVKLYEPLPEEFDLKTQLWVVELLSKPQAYQVDFPFIPTIEDDFTYIAGPNFNLNVTQELGNSSQTFSYNTLVSSNITSSVNQIKSLLNEKEININVNYEDFSNFIHFSTALTRLENFYYKVSLIENYTNELNTITSAITSDTTNTFAYSSSLSILNSQIDTIIHNFDSYEYFMYFNSGSNFSYPKINTTPPFTLAPTGSSETLTWLGSADENNAYYGGVALSASIYDEENQNRLHNTIPEYLREDPNNYKYELFVDMVSQHYDNIWLYTKDVTNKFNADNRLDYGISKDLIADAIKDFGIKLYSNSFNTTDLYSAFLGITPSGSLFPFPDMTGSLPTPSGYEYVDTQITSSNVITPLNDVNKRLYKRIYHNIPYLLKTKGTVAGLRALITSYGIPDTILRVNEFGGKDRNESQDWDLKQNVFNYAFNTGKDSINYIQSPTWDSNPLFPGGDSSPKSIQLRFKSAGIPAPINNIASTNIRYSQSLFSTDQGGNLVLEYTGNGFVTDSHSGSITNPYDNYGTLKFIPAASDNPSISASVYLPFFNEGWWSVQINVDSNNTASLYVANEIDGRIGFNESSSTTGYDGAEWADASIGYLNKNTDITPSGMGTYQPFSGSFQEWRYWVQPPSQNNFYNFTVNPYSTEGNGTNTTPDHLYFRADLGTQLNTSSRTSIHPRVTGSAAQITSSFDGGDSNFTINVGNIINATTSDLNGWFTIGGNTQLSIVNGSIRATIPTGSNTIGFSTPISTVIGQVYSIKVNATKNNTNGDLIVRVSNVESLNSALLINISDNSTTTAFNQRVTNEGFTVEALDCVNNITNTFDTTFDSTFTATSTTSYIGVLGSSQTTGNFIESNLISVTSNTSNDGVWVTNVENIFQDQAPSGIKNRITDKIALENVNIAESPYGFATSSSTVPTKSTQNSLSPFQSIQQESFVSSSYTPDVNYLEVTFSPSNQINDDINAQIGYFNIGDYIGDPRQISSSDRSYPNLDTLRDAYFEKYIKSYNIVDFIRLIKFFDNSLFKMIKDFTPARTSLASGVVVKQHLLERNRQRPAQVSLENVTYSGSIKPQSRNYDTGSGDVGQYEAMGGSSIYKFTGGTGGSFERFNGLQSHPEYVNNRFNLTQSYSESIEGSIANTINNEGEFVGYREILTTNQDEFYNGEFSGSNLTVTTQSLNPDCGPYLKVTDKSIFFNPIIFSLTAGSSFQGTTTENEIRFNLNTPKSGDAWIISEQTTIGSPISKVKYIKLSNNDINGVSIKNYLEDSPSIKWVTSDANVLGGGGVAEYIIEGVTTFANSTLLRISQTQGDNIVNGSYFPITSSQDAGSENWSLIVHGNYTSSNSLGQDNDNLQQGNFINSSVENQKQHFWYWNDITSIQDTQSFFNPGLSNTPTSLILSDETKFNYGSYNPKRTSNIPWLFSASISYSSSDLGTGNIITTNGTYHSASKYSGLELYDQDFTFSAGVNNSGVFKPSPLITENLSNSVFKTTYNNLIPGDSGSAPGLIGGHPKIKLPGTASLDFYFPSLTIGGVPRTLNPAITDWTPLSGSLISTNDNFSLTFYTPNGIGFEYINWSGSGESEDGALRIDYEKLENRLELDYGQTGVSFLSGEISLNLFISASISNFTASISSRYEGNTSVGNWERSNIIPSTGNIININNGKFVINPKNPNNIQHYTSFKIELKSPEENFEYSIGTYNGTISATYFDSSFNQHTNRVPISPNNAWETTLFQSSSNNLQEFTSSITSPAGSYPTISLQANLKKIGLNGDTLITSSNIISNEEIFGGKTFIFADSPITQIPDINLIDDMYYIEYSMSKYNTEGDTANNTFNVEFLESGDINSKILISQTASSAGSDYNLTGSLLIEQGNYDNPNQMGDTIISQQFIVPNSNSNGSVTLTGSFEYPFKYDDTFRMAVEVSKSFGAGLTITEYSMSIFPSQSLLSPLPDPTLSYSNYKIPTSNGFIIPSYFGANILPFNLALDCQPLLNNYNDIRENPYLMDISFNNVSGSIQPVNFTQILSNTADKASVPESNYTSTRSIRPRYLGTKTTSADYNIWSIQDVDTFGKNPVIELKDAYFGYFTSMKDLYPLVNDKISLELTYLLDQQSNAIPPSLEGYGIDILKKTFPLDNPISIGFISASNTAQELDDSYPIFKITEKPTPILYTQTSSAGYTTNIPLTGSGRISMYDNNDIDTFVDYSFIAQGTSSWADGGNYTKAGGIYTQIINPTEEIVLNPYNANSNHYLNPYSTEDGTLIFSNDPNHPQRTINKNPQRISMQTSFATSFLNESGGVELAFDIQMLSGSTPVNFELEDISLKVYRSGKEPFDVGSIIGTGIDNLLRFVGSTSTKSGGLFRRSKNIIKTSNVGTYNEQRGSYYALIENIPLNSFLVQKGIYTAGKGGILFQGDITGLEFIIKANSGKHIILDNDQIKFQLQIEIQNPKEEVFGGNVLFPTDYDGPIFPAKISTIGERTALLAGDNIGSAPFWAYENGNKDILIMSSPNINEAYGSGFYQGPTPYQPGPSEYFDSGVEPPETQFPKITLPIEFFPGDEIRFGNNENHSYTILSITHPENNINGGSGKIKIKLDREVPENINKDFFLIRRYTPKASSFIINTPFPYASGSLGSTANGIIYPTFPTEFIKTSGSLIITDLISKGVIT